MGAGSELLYDGLPASSLEGQPLAMIAVKAHLARPAIPAATELLRGLCAAAGLCLERAECTCIACADHRSQGAVVGGARGGGTVAALLACNACWVAQGVSPAALSEVPVAASPKRTPTTRGARSSHALAPFHAPICRGYRGRARLCKMDCSDTQSLHVVLGTRFKMLWRGLDAPHLAHWGPWLAA